MYSGHYGLHTDPFRLTPDPRFCYEHASYQQALTALKYALHKQEGIAMLTGDPGLGKTSLIADLTERLSESRIRILTVTCSQNSAEDLVALVARALGLNPAGHSKTDNLHQIEQELRHLQQVRALCPVLILDEVQTLDRQALEQLRLLTNLHLQGTALLQIFIVGQRTLRDTVLSPGLEQLHQRIVVSASLEPMDDKEVKSYVMHRLRLSGWKNHPQLTEPLFSRVHYFSAGIPRWINLIFSRLFLHGMGEEKVRLGPRDLDLVVSEMLEEHLLPDHVRSQATIHPGDRRASS